MDLKLLAILLVLSVITASCNKYTKNQTCTKDSTGSEHCMKKDEYETEDDEEPVFYDEEEEGKKNVNESSEKKERLNQWDPVRVRKCYDFSLLNQQKKIIWEKNYRTLAPTNHYRENSLKI